MSNKVNNKEGNTMTTINLGDEVKDVVTGFQGVAIAKCDWLYGCTRITVQPPVGKDGKVPDNYTFDMPSLRIIKRAKVKRASNDTGGSQNDRAALRQNVSR